MPSDSEPNTRIELGLKFRFCKRFRFRTIIIYGDNFHTTRMRVLHKLVNCCKMINMKIFIRYHGTTSVIFALANDMHARHIKSVRIAYNSPDIKIVRQVFDCNFRGYARLIEVGNNLLIAEAFIFID